MKLPASGRIRERITAIGSAHCPVYIIRGQGKSLMVDAGVSLLGPRYLASVRDLVGDAGRLDYLFLTHSHYDHVGSAGYLKRHLPGLTIGAHERVAGLLRKASVLEALNGLSDLHTELLKYNPAGEDLTIRPFEIDLVLRQGDEIDLGGLTCRVCETPGHTRDSLSFWLPESKSVFPGEACGVLRTGTAGKLHVEFVASFDDYVSSLKLLGALEPEVICLAHNWVLTDEDAPEFLQHSLAETFRYRELVEHYLTTTNGDIDKTIQELARIEFDPREAALPPAAAYMTNLAAQVKHIAELRAGRAAV
jgi:glyoxylase-like metal-dependent hydrolase (beta-lactamase superfamily II)